MADYPPQVPQVRGGPASGPVLTTVDGETHEIEFDGLEGDSYIAPLDLVRGLPLAALRDGFRLDTGGWALTVSTLSSEYWDSDYADRWLALRPDTRGRVQAEFLVWAAHDDDPFDHGQEARLYSVLTSLLSPDRATVKSVTFDTAFAGLMPPWPYRVSLSLATRGRSVDDIARMTLTSEALVKELGSGSLELTSVLAMLRAGLAAALVGQPESIFLDAKRSHYDLATAVGKIELAQDVARFANAEQGGVIVVGMRGKRVPGGEIITGMTPVHATRRDILRYRQAIESRVIPLIDGLDVFSSDVAGGSVVAVHVPPQVEELKPFLVHGAIVGRKVEGAFISIVRRRDEHSIPITASAIHTTLAAGRALLRRGEIPDSGSATDI